MENNLEFVFHIGILLLAANIGGLISKKLKQPAVLGQIIAGILLGLGLMEKTEFIAHISEIGVIFLMFIAGLETDVEELKATGKSSATVALLGVVVPMGMVSGVAYLITGNLITSLIVGLISIATSVSISVQTLKEIGFLRSKQGVTILGAAIIDDIIGVILLTLIIGVAQPGEGAGITGLIINIIVVFLIIIIVGLIITKALTKMKMFADFKDKIVGFALVLCLILAFVSEEFGVAAITGAYFSGVIFSMSPYSHKIAHDVQTMSDMFFTPIFFAAIGLGVELNSISQGILFSLTMLALGIVGKIVGCGFGARMTGFTKDQSLQVGIGMVPRAEVSLIIANLGLSMSLISEEIFSSAIVLVIATTLITPPILKWSFRNEQKLTR